MKKEVEIKQKKTIGEMTIDEFFEYMYNKKYQEFINKKNEPYIQIHDPEC